MTERIKNKILDLGRLRAVTALAAAIAIVLTLIFIISNSAKSQEESTEQSSSFKEIIVNIIPEETNLGKWILDNIRKIAHFTEYGLLGIESSVLITALSDTRKRRIRRGTLSLLFAMSTAFIDETVQIFAKRGPSISDMWIDIGGFFTYSLLAYTGLEFLFLIVKSVRLRAKRKETE